jgi:outer membrane protein assembly factor BamD (BamD/ComL family)
MGTWSASITGNDTAQDLLMDYQAAFSCNDIETALMKIDRYILKEMFDETDEEEWCNYMYSLADYMWKKGILTMS